MQLASNQTFRHTQLRSRAVIFTVLSLMTLGYSAAAQTPAEAFDQLFDAAAAETPRFALGAAFAFGVEDPIVRVAGSQSIKSDTLVGKDAPWHVGSITKSFTATLVMRLAERGLLDLDAPIGPYLRTSAPDMHADWQALTLRQLLRHTAGIPANPSIFGMTRHGPSELTQARLEALRRMWPEPIGGQSGSYDYSNIGYVLAGIVVETVTNTPWERQVAEEIAEPLGLNSLGFGPPMGPDVPWGHSSVLALTRAMGPTRPRSDNPRWMGPAGLMHLSLSDMVNWGQAHLMACKGLRPELLSEESCLMMRTQGAGDYGMGFVVRPLPAGQGMFVGHAGSNTKWYAVLGMVPEHNLVLAVAINQYDGEFVENLFRDMTVALME